MIKEEREINNNQNSFFDEKLWNILKNFFQEKGLVRHQIDSFNDFIQNNMQEIVDDMPQALKDSWLDYRQRLRDWPNRMQSAGNSPLFAYYMEPIMPGADPVTGMIDPDTTSVVM